MLFPSSPVGRVLTSAHAHHHAGYDSSRNHVPTCAVWQLPVYLCLFTAFAPDEAQTQCVCERAHEASVISSACLLGERTQLC